MPAGPDKLTSRNPVSRRQKLGSCYRTLAIIFLNLVLIFFGLNLACALYFEIEASYGRRAPLNPVAEKYGISVAPVYPEMNEAEVIALMNECWPAYQEFEPFMQIKEEARTGRYVNVDPRGFRITRNQGPWPPAADKINVFLLGGSTTFGRGVADHQTIASYLQEILNRRDPGKEYKVYNFGRGSYYSTPERLLLQHLLITGFIPDLAIFIDGYNDFYHAEEEPYYVKQLSALMENANEDSKREMILEKQGGNLLKWGRLRIFLESLPLARAAVRLQNRLMPSGPDSEAGQILQNAGQANYRDEAIISRVIDRYLQNKKMIEAVCALYDVTPIFVWQPVPNYKYDLKYHVFAHSKSRFNFEHYDRYGYPAMARLAEDGGLGRNFLWCADIQEGETAGLYVDRCHYTAGMSEKLAGAIYQMLSARGFLNIRINRKK
jgi:hypothetical protein